MQTLGGTTFIHNGIKFDYNFKETIQCLSECCDKVVVVDAGSDDGTTDVLKTLESNKVKVIYLSKEEWDCQHGKEKLCYFTDKAISELDTDYNFYLQCDEILHENSYEWLRKAMEDKKEGYLVKRINLWGSPYMQLNVSHNRKPCSAEVLRLAKPCYKSYGDAESIAAPCISDYVDLIRIYHMGFVRKKEVMKDKIIHMQTGVFEMAEYDPKLNNMEVFEWRAWFSDSDLMPIGEPLPAIIQDWAKERE